MNTQLEQRILFCLNEMAARKIFADDGKCAYCGLRARIKALCVLCEERRQRLSEKYPGVTPVKIAQEKIESGFTKLGNVTPPRFSATA